MYYPTKDEFTRLAKEGNLIPVYREILADFETPLSAFTKIDKANFSFLLESVEGGERLGRYSFLGASPSLVLSSKGKRIELREGKISNTFTTADDPIEEMKRVIRRYKFVKVKGLPRFCGGLVGYFGYDIARFIEKIGDKNKDDMDLPD